MSRIDSRIVEMKFNNQQFERNISQSTKSLKDLKESLKLDGAKRGLEEVEKSSKGFSLSNIADAVSNIADKFSILGAVGFTVIQNLTNSAMNLGKKLISNVLDPIFEGGQRRALNLEAAKFQLEGLGVAWDDISDSILGAVQGTAFGLDEAAKAASQLYASQVPLENMEYSLRAISGTAAMTNSSFEDTASIFTKVAGQGRLMGDDLNRLGTRGLNAAATLANAFGTTEEEVRNMVSRGEVSFEMFASAMDDAFGEHATKANETYTGSLANMRAALARIGAAVAGPRLEYLRDLFNSLTPVIDEIAKGLSPLINLINGFMRQGTRAAISFIDSLDFSAMPGILARMSNGIKYFASGVMNIVNPIRRAFLEMFPPASADTLMNIAKIFQDIGFAFMQATSGGNKLQRIFAGVFAVFSIGWEIIKGLVSILAQLFGVVFEGGGGFLEVAAKIGDFLVMVRNAIVEGDRLKNFFATLGGVLATPIAFLKGIVNTIGDLVASMLNGTFSASSFADSLKNNFRPVGAIWEGLLSIFSGIGDGLKAVWDWMSPVMTEIGNWIGNLGTNIGNAAKNADWSLVFDGLNTGLIAGFILMIRQFFKGFSFGDIPGLGILDQLKGVFEGVTGQLEAMQQRVKADILIKIAIAVGILAAALFLLALIDPAKLTFALGAVVGLLGSLVGALWLFEKVSVGSHAKFAALSGALILLSIAVLILSIAVSRLGQMDPADMIQGLVGIAGMLIIMAGAAEMMGENTGKMMAASIAMGFMAVSLILLSIAVKRLGEMDTDVLIKGTIAIAALLGIVAGFSNIPVKGIFTTSIALIALGIALNVMAGAVAKFGEMPLESVASGVLGIAGSLIAIGAAMRIMPKNMLATSVALVIVGAALLIIGKAMKSFGGMSWEEIGKSMVMLAGSLLILAGALYLMTNAIGGAIALTIVSIALGMLVPVLIALGQMSWGQIGMGLAALGLTLLVIAAAGMLLTPAVPGLLGLGAAIALIGLGAALAGVGMMLFATGLVALAGAGAAGAAALKLMILTFADLIPELMTKVGEGIVALAKTLADSSAAIVDAIVTILLELLTGLADLIGPAVELILELVLRILEALADSVPAMVDAGLRLLVGILEGIGNNLGDVIDTATSIIVALLDGIARNLPDVISSATDVIVAFIDGISKSLPRILQAGADLIISFLEGVANTIRNNSQRVQNAGWDIASAIIEGMANGLFNGVGRIADVARNVASSALNAAKNFLGINSPSREFSRVGVWSGEGLIIGLGRMAKGVGDAGSDLGASALTALRDAMSHIPELLDDDLEPIVITPILDLSEVEDGFNDLDGPGDPGFYVGGSASMAREMQEEVDQSEAVRLERMVNTQPSEIKFVQNNHSPKHLTPVEIFRNTRNQISFAREELKRTP